MLVKNSKSIKIKILFLYLFLLGAVFFSGRYIYKEANKFTMPEEHVVEESNKIFLVSSTINNLYSSEAYSRNAILTGSKKDIAIYYKELDTIVKQIETIQKQSQDVVIIEKLDRVQDLLKKKKSSFKDIINARIAITEQGNFDEAFMEIYTIREEIEEKIEPIVIQSREKEKRSGWARLFKGDNVDTIQTTVNYPNVTDSIISAMQKVFTSTQEKINTQQKKLLEQEQRLLLENRNITNQLREILENVEKNIVTLSYQKINESKSHISTASTNIAYIGGSALLVVIILGWIIIRDINQTQEYRKTLEKLNEEREVLLRSKTMLLATVTHDLQTPLGSLIGFTDLLKQTELAEKQQKYVNNIKISSQYISNLVNDLTDFSRLENNKISIQHKNFNPKELIAETCALLVPNAENKKIILKWNINPMLNTLLYSDPHRIKQILTNLITNAIKFTQDGGVFVDADVIDNQFVMRVTDTGIGIAKDQTDNIFKEFKQAHDGIEKKYGGTGLGLNISKRMIELLNGTIDVESVVGEGSVFTITLPLVLAQEDVMDSSKVNYQESFAVLKDTQIMVVDDDKIQLQLMEEVLTPIFAKVTLVNDPSEIEVLLEEDTYNIILSDIQMPKIDGFEMLSILKANPKFAPIPVIALSGKRDLSNEDFLQAGFASSHQKPIDINELLTLITKCLYPDYTIPTYTLASIAEEDTLNTPYNTQTLKQFIGDDKEALRNLMVIFLESTTENLLDLNYACEEHDFETLGNIAHKMLPMFRQLEIYSVIPDLESLEDRKLDELVPGDLTAFLQQLEHQIQTVLTLIKRELLEA